MEKRIINYLKKNPFSTINEIAHAFNRSYYSISKIVYELYAKGILGRRIVRTKAKKWYVKSEVIR